MKPSEGIYDLTRHGSWKKVEGGASKTMAECLTATVKLDAFGKATFFSPFGLYFQTLCSLILKYFY